MKKLIKALVVISMAAVGYSWGAGNKLEGIVPEKLWIETNKNAGNCIKFLLHGSSRYSCWDLSDDVESAAYKVIYSTLLTSITTGTKVDIIFPGDDTYGAFKEVRIKR